MKFPETRLRRLRYNNKVRNLVENVSLSLSDLIYPIFVCEGNNIKNEIKSLPGQYQLSIEMFCPCEDLKKSGIQNIMILAYLQKDETGEISCNQKVLLLWLLKKLKKVLMMNSSMADVSTYKYYGHCGTIVNNEVDNDLTISTC